MRAVFWVTLGVLALSQCTQVNAAAQTSHTCVKPRDIPSSVPSKDVYDYIVIGSGAGGGPVAARLAQAGFRVVVLDAGGDGGPRADTVVPAFSGVSTEDPEIRWDYFVDHYSDVKQAETDMKYYKSDNPLKRGVLYPRASMLGGCTEHNAMITIRPHDADWDRLSELTKDPSWKASAMKKYWKRVERCGYRDNPSTGLTSKFGLDVSLMGSKDHGFDGWLSTRQPPKRLVFQPLDREFLGVLLGSLTNKKFKPMNLVQDPNTDDAIPAGSTGSTAPAIAVDRKGQRSSTRTLLRDTKKQHPDRLDFRLHSLATKLLFASGDPTEAIGVEYEVGKHLYSADPNWVGKDAEAPGGVRRVYARREVIVSTGTFNTPQLLMLSGIGDREQLKKFDISTRVHSPGVGRNLMDRYEVAGEYELKRPLKSIEKCKWDAAAKNIDKKGFTTEDPCLQDWLKGRTKKKNNALYTVPGPIVSTVLKTEHAGKGGTPDVPDMMVFLTLLGFHGYFKDWFSSVAAKPPDRISWLVLHGHTRNHAGYVRLRSSSPRVVPYINFKYYHEGDGHEHDLNAMAEALDYVRNISIRAHDPKKWIKREVFPGPEYKTKEDLKKWAKKEAWGHHACCTAKIGAADDEMAVLDSKFRVRGTKRLRVVDASVFPEIPGFFIVAPLYIAAERAADDIIAAAKACGSGASGGPTGGSGRKKSKPKRRSFFQRLSQILKP